MPGVKISRLAFIAALAPVLAGLICACSETAPQPTLDELVRRPDFEQCLRDSGVQAGQLSDCMANNPDEASARDCIAVHVSGKNGAAKATIDRCFNLRQQQQPASTSPMGLNCYQGLMGGVTCK